MICAGVDVGGRRKGFHAAAVKGDSLASGPERLEDSNAVVRWLAEIEPKVIALDSPMTCAPSGQRSRPGERALAQRICGIRWTPEPSKLDGNPYYEWIVCGLELYTALEREGARRGWQVIEVFPTASWTVWAGPRSTRSRARWTREALGRIRLAGLPPRRLSQDDRDAIAAALTAQFHATGRTEQFGEIVVPVEPLTQ